MLQTAAIMACWVEAVRRTGAKAGALVDDRTLWATGGASAENVEAAVDIAEKFDGYMKLEWNLKKCETFASTPALREACETTRSKVSPTGTVMNPFELLGTAIHLHGANRTAFANNGKGRADPG